MLRTEASPMCCQFLRLITRNGQGIPFNFLLRDILQYQTNLNDVESALKEATRTIDLILGFGYGGTMDDMNRKATLHANIDTPFIGVQYAANQIRVYDDTNMLPVNKTWHPKIENVVYHGMDWDCPAWTSLLGKKILEEGKDLKIITVGSKGLDQIKRGYGKYVVKKFSFKDKKQISYSEAEMVGKEIINLFNKKKSKRLFFFKVNFNTFLVKLFDRTSCNINYPT